MNKYATATNICKTKKLSTVSSSITESGSLDAFINLVDISHICLYEWFQRQCSKPQALCWWR